MKLIKRLIVMILVLMTCSIGMITIRGYVNYATIVNDIGIERTIDDIMNDKDYVDLTQMSETFVDAIVSTEDRRFYEHNGLDYISIGRALLLNIKKGEIVSGGSTITQQLSKNLFLTFERRLDRKATEVFLAKHIENVYTKEEILSVYLNIINFGEGCEGIKEASEHYFNKKPKELDDSEAVLLAGLPQSPSYYSLNYHYDAAVIRSEVVLKAMLREEIIVEEEVKRLFAEIREGVK